MKTFIKLNRTDKALFILRAYAVLLGLFASASFIIGVVNAFIFIIK